MGKLISRFIVLLFVIALPTEILFPQNTQMRWSSFNMGYDHPKTSNTRIMSVAGQMFTGTTRHLNTQISIGFLVDTLLRNPTVSVENKNILPTSYSLSQNYPNPFNPSTVVQFQLPIDGYVTLKVYNTLGSEVAILVNDHKKAGTYKIEFCPTTLSSGVYFYRIVANDFSSTKKLMLLK